MTDENDECEDCGGELHSHPPDALRALPVSFHIEKEMSEWEASEKQQNTVRRLLNQRALMLTLLDQMQGVPAYHAALRENSRALADFGIPSDVVAAACDHMLGQCQKENPWEA